MIHELSDECLYVGLTDHQAFAKEFQQVNEAVEKNPKRHVIMDFSNVQMLTSSNLSNLLILHNLLGENGYMLIICNVSFQIKCEFTACGLRDIFNFADDKHAAMEKLGQKI
ncbi:MAG: STAS domain-containing protein [Phycisphaerae bacterium]|jgi:anti-anti-sigma factor